MISTNVHALPYVGVTAAGVAKAGSEELGKHR